jgi:hypothetical protein
MSRGERHLYPTQTRFTELHGDPRGTLLTGEVGRVGDKSGSRSGFALNGTAPFSVSSRLVLLLTNLLPVPLASERFFHALLLARLQIKRVTLDFFNDVFGLNFPLEPPKSILKRLAFLYTNLCQG